MDGRTKLKKYKAMYRCSNGYGESSVNKTIIYAADLKSARIKLISTYTFEIEVLNIVEVRNLHNGLVTRVIAC